MPLVNTDVADAFEEIADLLEVQGANPFRVRAYRNAARTVSTLSRDLRAMVEGGEDLDALPAIGPDLARKITEMVRTGRCVALDQLRREVPPGVRDMLSVPGLGPTRVSRLLRQLHLRTLPQLRIAAQHGRLREVPGFGPGLERRILDGVEARLATEPRTKRVRAAAVADALLQELSPATGVERLAVAGSLRRGRDTVGDLDLLAAARDGDDVTRRFVQGARVARVLATGPTRSSVVLRDGLQVDLRVVPPDSFGAAWLYFTGSRSHDIALRRLARARGLKLNEYGLFRGTTRLAAADEASVYAALGLRWIPPELREARGEIEAARAGTLPTLVSREDLRGDLHAHTRDSDGQDTLEAMAAKAAALGLEYLAITDHASHVAVTHGLDANRLARQVDRIDEINARGQGPVLLKGVEVDILEDGSLDLPDDLLRRLDLVVGAVHQAFTLSRARQTTRLLRAMSHPHFTVLAHPTARLLGERAGIDLDLRTVLAHACERGCFVEMNAQPDRLDLDDNGCRLARDAGVLVAVSSDAHRAGDLDLLRTGVVQARRGWLRPADVLNTRPLAELRPLLDRAMGRPAAARAPHRPVDARPATRPALMP